MVLATTKYAMDCSTLPSRSYFWQTARVVLSQMLRNSPLSQQLALDINSTLYVTVPDNPLTVVEKLWAQISNHMCACVAIGEGIEPIRGIAASEPILSEAASRVMRGGYGFNLPDALQLPRF